MAALALARARDDAARNAIETHATRGLAAGADAIQVRAERRGARSSHTRLSARTKAIARCFLLATFVQ
jgi:hypothetical protein